MKTYEIKQMIIDNLKDFWKAGLINTRFEVICYLVGFFGSVSENYTEAVQILAHEGYIKE